MSARIDRLNQFASWMEEDPTIVALIDETINKRVKTAARRQVFLSASVAVLSLMAGWLLNAAQPQQVLAMLLHR